MRILALILVPVLLAACGSATATAPMSVTAAKEPTILASEGGVLRPIANGGRVTLREGWATVRLSPVPIPETADLEVTLFGSDGRPVPGDVEVSYESIDMDHGRATERSVLHGERHRMPLSFVMPGAWRLVIRIARGGTEETVTLVLPEVGL